jgi:hypothetical protein
VSLFGRCQGCKGKILLERHGAGYRAVQKHRCGEAAPAPAAPKKWSAADPTEVLWPSGEVVKLPSRTEARVAERLIEEAAKTGARLYRQVRIPLLSGAAGAKGIPCYLTVDFAVVAGDGTVRYIDAKSDRKGREWVRGTSLAGALPVEWLRVEETDR